METVKTVAILSPGDMGSNVGRALRENGLEVITCLTERSRRTKELSEIAGIIDVPDFEEMIERADLVLSVLVPERAVEVARQVAAVIEKSGKPLAFADCNPVAPAVAHQMSGIIEAAGGEYIDGGIIGSPPGRGEPPRFYASGPHEAIMGQLDGRGISVPMMGGDVGRASAIKMCYASLSKGAAALNASALISAMNLGIYDEFIAEMEASQQAVLSTMQGVNGLGAKAFRWIDEMEQISATFGSAGATPHMHKGAADTFRLVTSSPIGHERPETIDKSRTLRETVELLAESSGEAGS
jgi:3-hydroxyisobutyrate dehydrogenase-like beta-hydroxyacid dehydrogenase